MDCANQLFPHFNTPIHLLLANTAPCVSLLGTQHTAAALLDDNKASTVKKRQGRKKDKEEEKRGRLHHPGTQCNVHLTALFKGEGRWLKKRLGRYKSWDINMVNMILPNKYSSVYLCPVRQCLDDRSTM